MNFIFECQEQYLTGEHSRRMRCYSCHKDEVTYEILRVMYFPVKYSRLYNNKGFSKPGFQNVAGGSIAEVSELTVLFFFFFLQENVLAFRRDINRWPK